jgi:hypothetical protein
MMETFGYTLVQYDYDSAIYVGNTYLATLEAKGVLVHPLGALFLRGNERWLLCNRFLCHSALPFYYCRRLLGLPWTVARIAEIPASSCDPDCVPKAGHFASAYGDSSLGRELFFESNLSVVREHYIAVLQERAPSWRPESSSATFQLDREWQADEFRTLLLLPVR